MKASRGKAGQRMIASSVTLYSHSVCGLWQPKEKKKEIYLGRGLCSCVYCYSWWVEHSRGSGQVSLCYIPMKNELLMPDQETKGTWALVLWEPSTVTGRARWPWPASPPPFTLRHCAQFSTIHLASVSVEEPQLAKVHPLLPSLAPLSGKQAAPEIISACHLAFVPIQTRKSWNYVFCFLQEAVNKWLADE